MKTLSTQIIPQKVVFNGEGETIDLKAICVFSALGFFLDDDTYYKQQKALKPATNYVLDNKGKYTAKKTYFKWYYEPRERSLEIITEEFTELFETIVSEQTRDNHVILPLSGGIDSRTQAAALKHINANVKAYSYKFHNGHDEVSYAKEIASACDFPFQSWEVDKGYLWDKIEELSLLNRCYSEFTHPRQMAFIDDFSKLGDVFSLGHWGDVLFDNVGVDEDMPFKSQVDFILGKIVKKGGIELATLLWENWGISGSFKDYLYQRVNDLLKEINIPENANAQIRAFKSLYWAPRWTSVNLSIFESVKPITLPYYDNRMCKFICSIPETVLSKRQIQIEYLKLRNPKLAKITWQDQRPFNLYNYHLNKLPYNLPHRILNKIKRIATIKKPIQRNWELQFLGNANTVHIEKWLFNNKALTENVSENVIKEVYDNFKQKNQVYYSHALSTLLTLSLFFKNRLNDEQAL